MINVIVELSKYVILTLMVIYTFHCFYMVKQQSEEERNESLRQQLMLIFFMDFPRRICLPQALYRNWKYKGRARESIAEGCDEKMDLEFLLWILRDGRSRERRQQFRDLMERYPRKVVVLKRRRDVRHCLELLVRLAAENQNRDRTGKITGNEELR